MLERCSWRRQIAPLVWWIHLQTAFAIVTEPIRLNAGLRPWFGGAWFEIALGS
jgi:hypothetical protein